MTHPTWTSRDGHPRELRLDGFGQWRVYELLEGSAEWFGCQRIDNWLAKRVLWAMWKHGELR